MKGLLTVVLVMSCNLILAQDRSLDRELLSEKNRMTHHEVEGNFFRGMLRIYNRHFSDQILNDCIYELSCSTFSQGAIRDFGLLKGALLTADRLMRCNRASMINIAPVRINDEGKIKDHWRSYVFRD